LKTDFNQGDILQQIHIFIFDYVNASTKSPKRSVQLIPVHSLVANKLVFVFVFVHTTTCVHSVN